ncbi:helix-turn-helix domain-containing protein [Flavilitoribacter nigricans]|uniref:Transcriptional regulator n=1 Tax=Flavilitoribacter nigricans (strain ATCC 23147 / DSM 23189 / NBRC 102662 / NCIMB 1420 / SS-2) TaxID=1122177 RepID=A0A2D0NH46_FLAN2|nr:helix-turn-helix transcriptional regulator [Flavilitoribacter nigricans]PHN07824.1 transcriptional regulator [Flavilitoribacter nigricans DSM 23189 = NBRC 102662]
MKDPQIEQLLSLVGERLKALRKAKGYSNYEQFAYENNIGRAQYGRYEKGSDLRLSSLFRVLQAMDISPADFFAEGFESPLPPTPN